MKHILLCALLMYNAFIINAQKIDTLSVLKSAPISTCDNKDAEEASKNTQSIITNVTNANTQFSRFVNLGPRLWKKIRADKNFKMLEENKIFYSMPKLKKLSPGTTDDDYTGVTIKDEATYAKLWEYLKTNFDLAKGTLSAKSTRDNFIFYSYYGKVKEPVTCISTPNARLILNYSSNKLFFMELTSQ
jgi:hypothetical protein